MYLEYGERYYTMNDVIVSIHAIQH